MSIKREQMISQMVRRYGFEHKLTIRFAKMAENPNFSEWLLKIILDLYLR